MNAPLAQSHDDRMESSTQDGPEESSSPRAARPKRIALLAYGTRGDIHPLLGVADELRRRGHSVVMTVNTHLVPWAERTGLEVIPTPPDTEKFLKSAEGRRMLSDGHVAAFAEELGKLERAHNAEIDRACIRCCEGADLILSTGLTAFRGTAIAEASGTPHRLLCTMPLQKTGAYATLLAPFRKLPLPALNRWSYAAIYSLWWRSFRGAHAETRARLGLPPNPNRPRIEELESVAAYSQAIMPDDSDRGAKHRVTGFVTLSQEMREQVGEAQPPDGLDDWLAAGTPPVYFGFGSMPVLDPAALLSSVCEMTRRRGLRALIGAGSTEYDASGLPDHVYVSPAFDHDRILPRCRAAVHHGGAGTTATVLRAGLPSVVVSVFADQPFWGWRVEQMRAGVTLPYQKFNAKRLESALERVLQPDVDASAKALGEQLRSERGAHAAVDVVEQWLR